MSSLGFLSFYLISSVIACNPPKLISDIKAMLHGLDEDFINLEHLVSEAKKPSSQIYTTSKGWERLKNRQLVERPHGVAYLKKS